MSATYRTTTLPAVAARTKRAVLATLCALTLEGLAGTAGADHRHPLMAPMPFSHAQVRIEVNATDGDSGIHVLLDAEGWKFVRIYDPKWKLIFEVEAGGSIRKTGLTELFFESAEPGFDELPLEDFLKRFPEGEYRFYGKTLTGRMLFSRATLTHALPDGPVLLTPEEDSVQDPANTVVEWEPVANPPGSTIVRYEVIVADESDTPKRTFSAVVPASVTKMTIPAAFMLPGGEYKFEVLAIEAGGNQTLTEGTFKTAP